MYSCLNTDEIIRLITWELVASGAKFTAVALGCCCKILEDPVLDTLWKTQNRLLPLLKCLPGDVWNEGGHTSFKRLPTTLECARFQKYARRMRKLKERATPGLLPLEVLSVLQLCANNGPLTPNLKTLELWSLMELIPFIYLFLSPKTTAINIRFDTSNPSRTMIASMITTLPTYCPSLRYIGLRSLPRDPMITAAISGMVLANNRNTLRYFHVDSPLTEEACKVFYKTPDLCCLSVVLDGDVSLPSVILPNLATLCITYDKDSDWLQMFSGATLAKLKVVTFFSESNQIGDFLDEFERVALSASVQNTISVFRFYTSRPWNPNYSSLLPFAQLTDLVVEFSCGDGCSSAVDDDIVINLARTMPKLKSLRLGGAPCHPTPAGVTAKGLVLLSHHCPSLSSLRIHFQVASLSAPPESADITLDVTSTAPRRNCGLSELEVGEIPVPEESILVVALTLVRIFSHIEWIEYIDENWEKVMDAIHVSGQIIGCSRAAPESNS